VGLLVSYRPFAVPNKATVERENLRPIAIPLNVTLYQARTVAEQNQVELALMELG